jgi:Flp pilus assembly protein TadD
MLTAPIMYYCISHLLNQGDIKNPDDEQIEALFMLLTLIGSKLDADEARVDPATRKMPLYFELVAALSRHARKMQQANPPHSNAVLSVAYDAYGSALLRLGRTDDAILAFGEAMALDPDNGVAVINMADAKFERRAYDEAGPLLARAQAMRLPDAVKRGALGGRFFAATNAGNRDAAAQALRDARASPLYEPWRFIRLEATFAYQCEFEEARADALLSKAYALHPQDAGYANDLAGLNYDRPEGRYREQGLRVSREAIAAGVDNAYLYGNTWDALIAANVLNPNQGLQRPGDHRTHTQAAAQNLRNT